MYSLGIQNSVSRVLRWIITQKILESIIWFFLYTPYTYYMLPLVKVTKLAKKQGDNKKLKIMKQNDYFRQTETNLLVRRCGEH